MPTLRETIMVNHFSITLWQITYLFFIIVLAPYFSSSAVVRTVPRRLQRNVMFGAPVARHVRAASLPLSDADFAIFGSLSILGWSEILRNDC